MTKQVIAPEVREEVVAGLHRRMPTLASALEKAAEWTLAGGVLHLVYEGKDRFHAEIARKQREAVAGAVSERLRETVRVKVEYCRAGDGGETDAVNEGSPGQVEMVRKVFKGEIVKGD
jgi:hypothetical protein